MPPGPSRPPFAERGGSLRGILDLLTGCYPRFLFGGSVGRLLPVFHLHETTPSALEPRLRYLAENGYRTVTTDAVARLAREGVHPGPRSVVLCFDDAWASLWTVAAPLLRRYGLTAVTFAIPARVVDAVATRPTLDDGHGSGHEDRSETPFVTWPELAALHASGTIDVQSHSWSHSMVFSADEPVSFVTPAFADEPPLNRPRKADDGVPAFLTPDDLGAPLYPARPRLSDTWRFLDDPETRDRCVAYVRQHGQAEFFRRERWQRELEALLGPARPRVESEARRQQALTEELDRARVELNARLRTTSVRHACAPWGIAGRLARDIARRVGYETLFADRLFGTRAVAAGDDPYSLMRLHERFIHCLPGTGRRYFHSTA